MFLRIDDVFANLSRAELIRINETQGAIEIRFPKGRLSIVKDSVRDVFEGFPRLKRQQVLFVNDQTYEDITRVLRNSLH